MKSNDIYVLGLSCYYHDSAACLIKNGQVIAAAHEERFTRIKHDEDFPEKAVEYCLQFAGISARDLTAVAFYEKPLIKFERILVTQLDNFPKGLFTFLMAGRSWLTKKLWIKSLIYEGLKGYEGDIYFPEHHVSHAASAFLVSPFERAGILTVDGVGEWASATSGVGEGREVKLTDEIKFPDSLGLLYSAFTYYLGFKVNSAEYKVMGLAPYGRPKYAKKIKDNLIDIKADGSFKMNMKYFAYPYGLRMTNGAFDELFGASPTPQGQKPEQWEMDMAASLQAVTDEVMVKMATSVAKEFKTENLCMAGGVALNCVSNSAILRKTPIRHLFIQPAAGDAGGSVGAALITYANVFDKKRTKAWQWQNCFLGPEYSDKEIEDYLKKKKVKFDKLPRNKLIKVTARLIEEQAAVGWFQGRMEFGPRALGNRSILADARNPENQKRVNLKIKFRESFRPFAPVVLDEEKLKWFDLDDRPNDYMLLISNVKKKKIPSVTHVDGTARLQTIKRKDNPMYYDVIKEFYRRTGVPVLINTSFNQRGEPIVCTPKDAFWSFLRTDIDYLMMGSFLLDKTQMPEGLIEEARKVEFDPD